MHHLHCVDLLWLINAKACDTFTGFDFKRITEVVCEGGGNLIGENASQQTLGKFNQNSNL